VSDHELMADSRPTLPFFLCTFAITWVLQLPALLALAGIVAGPPERFMAPAALGAFGPLFAALLVARFEPGGPGVRALFGQFRSFRVGLGWYVLALLLPGALLVAGMAAYSLFAERDPGPWFYPPTGGRIAVLFLLPISEEIGWRGFALPRLQERFGALSASVILGVLWGLWHVPMLLLAQNPIATLPLLLALFIPGSVVFSWLYNRTPAGLPLVVVAHVGVHLNNSHIPLPGNLTPVVVHTLAYATLAIVLILADRKTFRGKSIAMAR
jgi:membrane protease YdiL (CAAX protease family)